jgi:hypothetical protein
VRSPISFYLTFRLPIYAPPKHTPCDWSIAMSTNAIFSQLLLAGRKLKHNGSINAIITFAFAALPVSRTGRRAVDFSHSNSVEVAMQTLFFCARSCFRTRPRLTRLSFSHGRRPATCLQYVKASSCRISSRHRPREM